LSYYWPESLVTAELAAALLGNSGFVLWAGRAFGPLAGSLLGAWKHFASSLVSITVPAQVR
jgi:amino acid transporter